jgi:hypothetical protein
MTDLRLPVRKRPGPGRTGRQPGRRHRPKPAGSRLHLPCQNWRMAAHPPGSQAEVLSLELAACRKRGIERLDVQTHNQSPILRPGLQRLADEYQTATGGHTTSPIAQLKYLLRDAITAFAAENEADAPLVKALFFGDSQNRVTKSAGELLDTAQRTFGFANDVSFRQVRHEAFDNFAAFLRRFVAAAGPSGLNGPVELDPAITATNDVAAEPEVQQQVATTGYVDNGEQFISLLSQAENITIIGFTNESLASMLRTALARKRAAVLQQDSCWSSVRIVFLGDDLLDGVSDERGYPDPVEAQLERRKLAVFGRRTVRVFLRGLPGRTTWSICDTPHYPPLAGTLFEMPDGRRIVQLLIRRRQRSASDHLFLQLDDTRGHYFSKVFDEIVEDSTGDDKMVPLGAVVGERFRAAGTRYRHRVLIDGSGDKGWLAMVLVITWRRRDGRAEPLLQLRSRLNAARELDRLSHLASHIIQDEPVESGLEFGLDDELPMAAARNRVLLETGEVEAAAIRPLATGQYLHPDKEHLFFFVYSCQLPENLQIWDQAEMSSASVSELVAIRENQVLRKALALCRGPALRRQVRVAAFEIVALNLTLHDHGAIAQKLTDAAAARYPNFDGLVSELAGLEEDTRQSWAGFEGEAELVGLSGLQYREFFTILLPLYARVGIPDAAEHLMLVRDDEAKRNAVERLAELYRDERIMKLIPVEL